MCFPTVKGNLIKRGREKRDDFIARYRISPLPLSLTGHMPHALDFTFFPFLSKNALEKRNKKEEEIWQNFAR